MAEQKWLQRYNFFMDKTKKNLGDMIETTKKQLLVAAVN